MDAATPRPSATVIIAARTDQAPHSDYRIFLVKRTRRSGFMAGAHVFPGGVLDAADADPGWGELLGLGGAPDPATALKIAAVRETFEESGVLLLDGADAEQLGDRLAATREEVHADASSFLSLCTQLEGTPALDRLWFWDHWITPKREPKRYDAVFYLVLLDELPFAEHDMSETVSSAWMAPEEALERFGRREIFLPPPTWYILRQMTNWPVADELAQVGRTRELPEPILPTMQLEGGQMVLLLPGDGEHPERPGAPDETHRILMKNGYTLLKST